MTKAKIIALIVAFSLLFCGLMFGLSKVGDFVNEQILNANSSASSDDQQRTTWYAADLPGAHQVYFYTFSKSEVNVPGIELEGDFYNNDGALAVNDWGIVHLLPSINEFNGADVVVYDFDLIHSKGTPSTTFDNELFLFTNQYFTDYNESGGIGEPVNAYTINCSPEGIFGVYDVPLMGLGDDFTKTVHVTILQYHDKTIYYINGVYLVSDIDIMYPLLYLCSVANNPDLNVPEVLDYGTVCIDNVECVTFGDGSGSYNGVLMSFKNNTSLKLSDIFGGN